MQQNMIFLEIWCGVMVKARGKVLKTPAWAISTLCGLGHFSSMPGTVGSLVACLFALLIPYRLLYLLIPAVILLGIWASGKYEAQKGSEDPSEVIIDEVAGVWIAMAGHVVSQETMVYALPALFLFRIFDILKPVPVSTAEKLPGGIGIVADDVVAGIFANVLLWGLRWLFVTGGYASLFS